jgi:MFS family permease
MSNPSQNELINVDTELFAAKNILKPLITIFNIIFIEFLIMGISLGVIPNYVHNTLRYSNLIVGIVIGLQYASTLCSRNAAGKLSDFKGGRRSVTRGIIISSISGFFCLLSFWLSSYAILSLAMLIIGRILLGVGESFLVIGIFTWGFIIVGSKHTGKVMVWNGMGMYGGMACGAPLGIFLASAFSLSAAFLGILLLPIMSFFAMLFLREVPLPVKTIKMPFYKAVKLVWKSGVGLALSSIGFAGIASFITLFFIQRSWEGASLAITAFGAGYVLMRVFFAHYPDKFGGARVAIFSLLIEIAGQLLIWRSSSSLMAIIGSGLTGLGMSLVFPSFGILAVKKVSAASRGMAMAAYNAFFDLGMGLTAPVAGLIAGDGNYSKIYILGALAAILSATVAFLEYKKETTDSSQLTLIENSAGRQ